MKQLAIVALVILAVASLASAQPKAGGIARELAMGGTQAGTGLILNPFIMEDPALMLVNPAYQTMYKDYAWFNVAGGRLQGSSINDDGYGNQNGGVAFGLSENMNLGVILSYDPSFAGTVSGLIGSIVRGRSSQTIQPILNVWELVASWHFNSLDLGLGVSYGNSNIEQQGTSVTPAGSQDWIASSSVLGFRGGMLLSLGSGNSLDASVMLHLDKATDKETTSPDPGVPTGTGEYTASGTEFQGTVRAKFNVSSKFNFVPYAMISTGSGEPTENTLPSTVPATPGPTKYTMSMMAIAFGLGGEYRVNNFYLAGGLSFQSARQKLEVTPSGLTVTTTQTLTYTAIPVVNLGMEWSLLDWLTGRMGYQRMIGSISQKAENSTGSFEISGTYPMSWVGVGGISPSSWDGLVTLGVGMKFGNFALDATVSDQALRRGFSLIGGVDAINTFGYMTASYNFGQ
jgi:hypothetical protein